MQETSFQPNRFPFLQTTAELQSFCRECRKAGMAGIDTEFVWEHTYYPQLGLIQIAYDREDCVLIDPLSEIDPAPFAELLADPSVTKIFHEAASDLPILHRWCGQGSLPCNIADTRYAAGFCGLTAHCSLAKLISSQLGIDLPKTETRSNWLQRPLTAEQLQYAGDDAALLPDLYRKLREQMETCRNLACFEEEMKFYSRPELYTTLSPDHAWQRVASKFRTPPVGKQLSVLQALACWRESSAQAQNKPRNFYLKDNQLIAVVQQLPTSFTALRRIPGITPMQLQHFGPKILQIITGENLKGGSSSAMHPGNTLPTPQTSADSQSAGHPIDLRLLKQSANRFLSLITKRGEERKIDPEIIGTTKDARSLAGAALQKQPIPADSPLFHSWRREILEPALSELWNDLSQKAPAKEFSPAH